MKCFAVLAFILCSAFYSCTKEPGKGGLATIEGRVYSYNRNSAAILTDSGYIAGERVYISYGGFPFADDDVRSGVGGYYRFEGLNPGTYTVWVLSECDTCEAEQQIVSERTEIKEKREYVVLKDLTIYY